MSLILIYYHVDHSSFLPLFVMFHFQWRETWLPPSAIHLLNCLIPGSMYSGFSL